jgi:hypothetical protein
MQERMGSARRMVWYCWLSVAFCSARSWMSFSCSVGGQVSRVAAWEDHIARWSPTRCRQSLRKAYLPRRGPLVCSRWNSRRWGSETCDGAASLHCLYPYCFACCTRPRVRTSSLLRRLWNLSMERGGGRQESEVASCELAKSRRATVPRSRGREVVKLRYLQQRSKGFFFIKKPSLDHPLPYKTVP